MAYFIVIGTNNDVKSVVDEIKQSHLQHNVITSGCLLKEDNGLYYHWDVFNEKGDKTNESKDSVILHEVLTNQISQFKTLIPDDAIPNVFIVSKSSNEEEIELLQMVYSELNEIGGANLQGLQVDLVLIGYDLNHPEDVTRRPHWRLLESIQGLDDNYRFHTNILYINNMDYMGAATNIDSHILSRFLCNWSKMLCSGGYDPKVTVHSHVYSIGMAEHQYDFRDLNEFFQLSAEERLLDRTLNERPSADTQELLNTNYFKKIDLDIPWLDGLCHIQTLWKAYCTSPWNPSLPISNNLYSVSKQEQTLASYLNLFLHLYITEEQREINLLNRQIAQKELENNECAERILELNNFSEEDESKAVQKESINERIAELTKEIEGCKEQIRKHEDNIKNNTFIDADTFYKEFGTKDLITEEDEEAYRNNIRSTERLTDYVKSDNGICIMREAIERATTHDTLPNPYPASEILNIGRVVAIQPTGGHILSFPEPIIQETIPENREERSGCLFWFKSLFNKNQPIECNTTPQVPLASHNPLPITAETKELLNTMLGNSVKAIKEAEEVRDWWNHLSEIVDRDKKRQAECILLMDGEKDDNGKYIPGKEGYLPKEHRKSISLIDMERVRNFRDADTYYKQMTTNYLDRWFDKTIESNQRKTMMTLIKHHILDPLADKFHTLQWNGSNPFVEETISNEKMHEFIKYDIKQSKPFVEYVHIPESNLIPNLHIAFFSNNPDIPTNNTDFRNQYNIGLQTICSVHLNDFANSLCVVQVMDIPNHVDSLKDFKPKRETPLNMLRTDIKTQTAAIIGGADTIEEKAKAIYNWICENIAYDTSKQIHDADSCYRIRRGVCQAYCELFCYMAETVGLTAEIITGITKDTQGNISDDKHSWIFVYNQGYDGFFVDPTWGAGTVDGGKFIKNEDNSTWFHVSPYWLIFTHFPDQQYWLKLDISITEEQFKNLPYHEVSNEEEIKNTLFELLAP